MLSACEKPVERFTTYSFDYFDTVTSIIGYANDQAEFDEMSAYILKELEEYHKLFTIYHRYDGVENLCTVNELADGAHRTVTVDKRIIEMLLYAKEAYEKTNGKVNIAMGSVLSIWHEYRENGTNDPINARLPSEKELQDASLHTDIDNIVIDEENCTVTLADPEMKLDVGAVAKGYAVEMVARSLEKRGITGYVLNVGGNVRTVGAKANGDKWTVGIENPLEDENEPYFAYLGLEGEALVTSGSYQRYYTVNDKNYHHIIDPETLMPSERYLSVSVISKNSAEADALSTALFCMDIEAGRELIEAMNDVEVLWVMNDGSKIRSSGFGEYEVDLS